ncbi:hypothetical protein V491_03379, partial [Pseudogymnoascus sp. VKM F-3775]
SRLADIPPFQAPEQPPAFAFPPANGIPRGSYGHLLAAQQGIVRLQQRDLLGVRGSVPPGGYSWGVEGEVLGPLHQYGGEGGEEPWPDVAQYEGYGDDRYTDVPLQWFPAEEQPQGEACNCVGVQPMLDLRYAPLPPLPNFFEPIFLAPFPEHQPIPCQIEAFKREGLQALILLPAVILRPLRFYCVQHSAAFDWRGKETCPPSWTRDSTVLGLSAGTIFPPCFERRISRANLERALDPMNVQPSSLIALYSNYGESVRSGTSSRGLG